MTDLNPLADPDLLQACARAQRVLHSLSLSHKKWWCGLDEVDVFIAEPEEIVDLLRSAPTEAAATYIYGLYQGRSEIAHITGRPLWPPRHAGAPEAPAAQDCAGAASTMWSPDPVADPAFVASARARRSLESAAQAYPQWWTLVEEVDVFSAPHEDLLDVLLRAPTDSAATYVLAFVHGRAELVHITGRPLI